MLQGLEHRSVSGNRILGSGIQAFGSLKLMEGILARSQDREPQPYPKCVQPK